MIARDAEALDIEDSVLSTLISALNRADQQLEKLTQGEVDTVADAEGNTFVLRHAQVELRDSEEVRHVAVLDALPANIAVIDAQGAIVAVNEAWKVFGAANGLGSTHAGVGLNYLETCDRAEGMDSAEATGAAAGIRRVLQGTTTSFSLEYPCHSPTQQRWFLMRAIRVADDRGQGAVVMHLDITRRVSTTAAMNRQSAELRALFDVMPAMIWFKDARNRILRVNQRVADAAGKSIAEIEGRSTEEIYPEGAARYFADDLEVIRSGQPKLEIVEPLQAPDGTTRWVQTDKVPVLTRDGIVAGIVVMARDVTRQKQADQAIELSQEALQQSEREQRESARLLTVERSRLVAAQRVAKVGDWEMDLQSEAPLVWSHEVYRIHEVDPLKFSTTRKACLQLVHPEDRARLDQGIRDSLGSRADSILEHRILLPGNRIKFLEERWRVTLDATGVPASASGTCQDITERKQSEIRIQRLNHGYLVLSQINALVARVRSRNELFQETCRIAVEDGEFVIAWIGVVDPIESRVVPVAGFGGDRDFMTQIGGRLSLDDDAPLGHGPAARAIREQRVVIVNDVATDPRIRGAATHVSRGTLSLISLPIVVGDKAAAVLSLHAADAGYFDEVEVKLLCDLAVDIAFAIDHIESKERVRYLSHYDPMTGLANQALFLERLQAKLNSAQAHHDQLAVIALDVQRFKTVNEAWGRSAGDELLKLIAKRLVSVGGDINRFARIGADRFAIVVSEFESVDHLGRYLEQRLSATFRAPFRVGDNDLRVSVKVGVAKFPDDGADAETLLRNAEAALTKAKSSGDRFVFFNPAMTERVAERLSLENRLRDALDNEEFVLHYQPKVRLDGGRLTGCEALIRWNDPHTGLLVPPMQFIPLLEETGLIHEVGRWALQMAIADYLSWRRAGLAAVRIAVNVSPLQLRNRAFVAEVEEALRADKHAAAGLELEITESLIMEDVKHSIEVLQALRALNVTIAIDDFGTGFSSLSYLAKLPIDTLKIDRSFVNELASGEQGLALVSTIITLAHSLRLKVVAEGVETEEQSHLLRGLRCDEMQGYLFSKPIPAHLFAEKFLRAAVSSPS